MKVKEQMIADKKECEILLNAIFGEIRNEVEGIHAQQDKQFQI